MPSFLALQTEWLDDDVAARHAFAGILRFATEAMKTQMEKEEEENVAAPLEGSWAWKYANETLKTLFNLYHRQKLFDLVFLILNKFWRLTLLALVEIFFLNMK
jgi:hypothetical protein